MLSKKEIPIDVVDLLPVLDKKLMELLRSLSPDDWQKQTIAKLWRVKDVVAHLLDGNIRILSIIRDNYNEEGPAISSYADLLHFLNTLNADWVKAMKRISPTMLIHLHEATGRLYCDYYRSLNPFDKARFPVAWAGEMESKNWMHVAREYTEKWLHQQQIRNAVNIPGIMTQEFFYPFIDIFMLALPHTYRNVKAVNGTTINITVTGNIGGAWFLTRANDTWQLGKMSIQSPATEILIDPDTSWKLFSKSLRPEDAKSKIIITGDQELGEVALTMVSVMA